MAKTVTPNLPDVWVPCSHTELRTASLKEWFQQQGFKTETRTGEIPEEDLMPLPPLQGDETE